MSTLDNSKNFYTKLALKTAGAKEQEWVNCGGCTQGRESIWFALKTILHFPKQYATPNIAILHNLHVCKLCAVALQPKTNYTKMCVLGESVQKNAHITEHKQTCIIIRGKCWQNCLYEDKCTLKVGDFSQSVLAEGFSSWCINVKWTKDWKYEKLKWTDVSIPFSSASWDAVELQLLSAPIL